MEINQTKQQFVKNIQEAETVDSIFLVKYSAIQTGKTGKAYLNLVLMDNTGEIEARAWDRVPELANLAVKDAFVWVEGKCKLFQSRRQITVKKLQLVRDTDINEKDFIVDQGIDVDSLFNQLTNWVESMEDAHYKALAKSILIEDEDIVDRIKRAPAAKTLHHAYKGGLLEHIVSISGMLDKVSQHYGKDLNRDLLLLGGFFHDIAKIWELSYQRTTDYTDEGRLIGHLVMGVELVTKKIRQLNESDSLESPFPKEKELLVKHLILSHHGELEYGSPKRPKLIEAHIIHEIDDLDSKINAMKWLILKDQNPGKWTTFNRQFDRFFYKSPWLQE